MSKEVKKLWKLFSLVLFVKVLLSFYMKGTLVFSDEPCVTQTAMYFAKFFKLESCAQITGMIDAGTTTPPLYPIIISPIYWFLTGMKAYYAILILNSILFSSLIFPLYSIFKLFIKNERSIFLNMLVVLFMTSTLVYEKILMTEGLFIVINVWLLAFYIKSLNGAGLKYKAIVIFLSLLAVISRPFGFIVPVSIVINEFIISKKKKLSMLLLIAVILISYFAIQHFIPELSKRLTERLLSLNHPHIFLLVAKALKNQLNSFTIGTFFIGLIMFLQILKQDNQLIKKLKYFLIAFVLTNFLISAQHIQGYLVENYELHLLTRYINMSIVYIYIFSLIYLSDIKKIQLNLFDKFFSAILIISFLFLEKYGKFAQNLDLLPLYKIIDDDKAVFFYQINLFLIPIFIFFLLLVLKNKKKVIKNCLIVVLVIQTVFSIYSLQNIQKRQNSIASFFLDKSGKKITYIVTPEYKQLPQFWKIASLTNNKLGYTILYEKPSAESIHVDADYIITTFDLDLPVAHSAENIKVYRNSRENF